MMCLFAALALFTVPADAAKQVNDVSDIIDSFRPMRCG